MTSGTHAFFTALATGIFTTPAPFVQRLVPA
jgi:hypothetical protein